jgi:hypothetical protein
MPAYTWMNEDDLNLDLTEKKINAMRTLGVPYPERYAAISVSDLKKQALVIATDIVSNIPGQKLSESQKQEKINSIVKRPETVTLPTTLEEFDFIPNASGKHKVYTSGRNKFYLTDTVSDKHGQWKVAFSFSATYKGWFVTQDDVAGFNESAFGFNSDFTCLKRAIIFP